MKRKYVNQVSTHRILCSFQPAIDWCWVEFTKISPETNNRFTWKLFSNSQEFFACADKSDSKIINFEAEPLNLLYKNLDHECSGWKFLLRALPKGIQRHVKVNSHLKPNRLLIRSRPLMCWWNASAPVAGAIDAVVEFSCSNSVHIGKGVYSTLDRPEGAPLITKHVVTVVDEPFKKDIHALIISVAVIWYDNTRLIQAHLVWMQAHILCKNLNHNRFENMVVSWAHSNVSVLTVRNRSSSSRFKNLHKLLEIAFYGCNYVENKPTWTITNAGR